MKKFIYSIFSLSLIVMLFSCEQEAEIWNSSTNGVDGNWYVYYDHSAYGHDPFNVGLSPLFTYNTAADNGQQIWLSDDGNFWDYKVRIPVNTSSLTFGGTDTVYSIVEDYEIQVIVNNGVIVEDAVKLPSGVMADSIYFEVWFEDLAGATGIAGDTLFVSGFRKSGFQEDEPDH